MNEARRLAEELVLEAVKVGSTLRHTIEVVDESGHSIIRLDGQTTLKETGLR